MKKTAGKIRSEDHAKPFIVAIGIAFTFLALVVIYIAFSKGGLDIRSRAGLISERCYAAPVKAYINSKPVYACLSGGTLKGTQCCIKMIPTQQKISATPVPCRPGTAGCMVKQGQQMQVQTTIKKPTPAPTKRLMSCVGAGSSCTATTKCCSGLPCSSGRCR